MISKYKDRHTARKLTTFALADPGRMQSALVITPESEPW